MFLVQVVCAQSSEELGNVICSKKHSQRSVSIRTVKVVQRMQDSIDANAGTSMKAITRDLQVSEDIICNVVHEHMSYVTRKGQFISAHTKRTTVAQSKTISGHS